MLKPLSLNRISWLGLVVLFSLALILLYKLQLAHGVAYTWDGGGSDGTCGGGAGDGNKWSCAANWSSDIVPTASDTVTFDSTSTKNATIAGTVSVAGMTIASTYSGVITQSGSNTLTVGASGYSQAGGTFTGGSGAITVNGTYTLSGGTFTSTTGTLQVTNSTWTHTAGGTFTHNSGTVLVRGTGDASIDVATSETFNNLTVNMDGGTTFTIASGDTLIALGTYNQIGGGKINTGTIEARGPVTTTATATPNTSTGTIAFLTTGDQTITSTSGELPNININKASGTVSVTGDLGILGFTLSSGTFTSTSGILTTRNSTWTHTAGGTFNHNSGTVVNRGTGSLTWDVATNETFNNFTVNLDAGVIFTISSGDTLVVLGTYNQTGGGSINTGTIEPRAGVTTNATGSGTGTISFLTSGDQAITATSAKMPNLNIAKVSGTVTLSGSLAVVGFTQSSGSFDGGTGTITNSGDFTLSGGTFISTTGLLTNSKTSGTWTHSGGTFNHNNGQVSFTHSGGTFTVDVPTTDTFYDFTLNVGNATRVVSIASGDTIVVLHTYAQTAGILNGANLEVRGNMTVGTCSSCTGGTATIYFLTTGDQTITPSGGQTSSIIINKPSGTVTVSGGGNLEVFSLLIRSGGFVSTSGTLAFDGDTTGVFTHTGGTFSHNSGTVSFTHDQGSVTINAPGEQFNNILINTGVAGRTVAVTSGQTITILGTLTQSVGNLDGGTAALAGNYTIGASAGGGTANLIFVGSANQTYTDNGGTKTTGTVTINKAQGTKVTLATNMTYTGAGNAVTITQGMLDQGASYNLSTGALTIGTNGVLQNTGTGSLTLAGTLTNSGLVNLNSNGVTCGDTDSIQLRSSVSGTQRSWAGSGKFILEDLDVKDMGGSATIATSSSTSTSGNGANWTFNATCPPIISAPNGGETWDVRSSQSIIYSAYSGVDHYRLSYSTDSGASWTQIATTSATTYTWTLPSIGSTHARVLVAAENSSNTVLAFDESDADFTLTAYGTTLNGGINFSGGVTF